MSSFLQRLKFTWEYWVKGRHRVPPVAVPPDCDYPPPDAKLMGFLVGMYREHGAEAVQVGNWICVDRGSLFTRAAHFDHMQHPKNLILQADFITITKRGARIVESFGGIGTDVSSALLDACKGYQDCTFHALFVTLLDHACEHVEREEWVINGIPRNIIMGWLRIRGHFPHELWSPIYEGIQRQIQNFSLTGGLHWCRYFYARSPSGDPTIEVLVDNETCEQLQSQAADLPWPPTEDFYAVRLFFTIQDS